MTEKRIDITQENYEKILELAKASTSRTNLLKLLGWDRNALQYQKLTELLLNNKFNPSLFIVKKKTVEIKNYDKETLSLIVASSFSKSEVLRKLNKKSTGASQAILKRYFAEYKLDTSHFNQRQKLLSTEYSKVKSNEELFVENSLADKHTIKKRLLRENLLPYRCHGKNCSIQDKWLGQDLSLHLEHKNGINNDNRLENLEFLCPNCHSQTATYCGRNIKNKSGREKINNTFTVQEAIMKKEIREKNIIHNILPLCDNATQVLNHSENKNPSLTPKAFNLLLEKYKEEQTVKDFLAKGKEKIKYPPLDKLLAMVKEKGFSAVGRDLSCSDKAIRKHLLSKGVDLEKELRGSQQEEFLKIFDKKLFLEKVLPKYFTYKSLCDHYGLSRTAHNYQILKNLLDENKNHDNVLKFLKRAEPKRIAYPEITGLVELVRKNGLVKTAKELGGTHASLRTYLIKNNIDPKVWAR